MKQLAEQYTSAVLAVIFLLLIWSFFWGESAPTVNELGQIMETIDKNDNLKLHTGNAFDSYMNVVSPVISVKDNYILKAGNKISLEEIFQAVSDVEDNIAVSFAKCWDMSGNEVVINIDADREFCISEPGIYWAYLQAEGQNNQVRNVYVRIFVNER